VTTPFLFSGDEYAVTVEHAVTEAVVGVTLSGRRSSSRPANASPGRRFADPARARYQARIYAEGASRGCLATGRSALLLSRPRLPGVRSTPVSSKAVRSPSIRPDARK